ncbi:hypothetical protein LTR95_011798 [Oleoguttula sp. CCFEE 5521]
MRSIPYAEVQLHKSASSCWVILYNQVWDVTAFLPSHPGGTKIILQLAGSDATSEYDPVHPEGTLESSLPPEALLGKIDLATMPKAEAVEVGREVVKQAKQEVGVGGGTGHPQDDEWKPETVEQCLNLNDIERLATRKLSKKAWSYYFSAGDDLHTKSHNNTAYRQILLRPRIFVDCTLCDPSINLLGNHKLQVPFFVSPAAMARLGHPDGEAGIARAAAKFGALQIISNNASQTPEQIVANAPEGQIFGWQLYVQTTRSKSEAMLARIHALPNVKFICLTLDAPVPGKREHDERSSNVAASLPSPSALTSTPDSAESRAEVASGGVGKSLFAGTAPDLTWRTTLPWLAAHTSLPIVLKGVQTHEDALLASRHTPQVQAIILSNHGGRALDTAPPAIHTLLEIRRHCPEVLKTPEFEVWLDGGIKRGTDIVKALALGAKAVGIGRAALFGLGAGGQGGVERVMEILRGEVETAMRLLGAGRVEELGPRCVNTRALERDIYLGEDGGGETEGDRIRSRL